jgi:hypothetical protein
MKTPNRRRSLHALAVLAVLGAVLVPAIPASAEAPVVPVQEDLSQAAGEISLQEGDITNSATVTFSVAGVSDPDNDPEPSQQLSIEVEVKPTNEPLVGSDVLESDPVDEGGTASVESASLAPGVYHWQVRVVDGEEASSFVAFGVGEGFDFRVNAAPDDPDPETLAQSANGDPLDEGGVTNDTTPTFSGTVTDPDNDSAQTDTLQLQIEIKVAGVGFNGTSGLQISGSVSDGATASITSTALSPATYHWRARAVDEHGAVSGWVNFGTLVIDQDFRVNAAPNAPATPTQANDTGNMAVGALTNDTTVDLKAVVTDPDNPSASPADVITLQVEVETVGTPFDNVPTVSSTPTAQSGTATATFSATPNNSYHWQARAVDQHGGASTWVSFGGNGESDTDFRIPSADVSVEQTLPAEVFASSGASTRTLEYSFTISNNDDVDAATPVIASIDFDDDRVVAMSALYALEDESGCDPDTALGIGNTVTVTSLSAGESVTVCVAVDVKSSPSPLIDGKLASSQSVSVASPVHDPDTDNNVDTDSVDIVTTPGAPREVTAFAGNESAVVTWKQPSLDTDGFPVNDGGDPINEYVVTVEKVAPTVSGSALPGPFTVTAPAPSPSDKVVRLAIGTDIASTLTNDQGYRFVVTAVNDVGTGPGTTSNTIVPSLNASAEIIDAAAGNSIQSTGNPTQPNTCALPVGSDSITGCQEFKGNTNGVGNILEKPQPTSNFCGTAPCMGSQVVQYEITELPDGRVLLSATYSKQLAGSTGTNFKVYYDRDGPKTAFGPALLAACPKKGPATAAAACVFKLTRLGPSNAGTNPNLLVVISAPAGDAIDPAAGTRR